MKTLIAILMLLSAPVYGQSIRLKQKERGCIVMLKKLSKL